MRTRRSGVAPAGRGGCYATEVGDRQERGHLLGGQVMSEYRDRKVD